MKYKTMSLILVVILINIISIPKEANALTQCNQIGNNGVIVIDTNLTDDLTTSSGDCITFGASSITLDCQSHSITGPGNSNAINTNGYNWLTIRNCSITNFFRDLYIRNTDNSNIENNIIRDFVTIEGINSRKNKFEDNNFYERIWIFGEENTFNQNVFEIPVIPDGESALVIDANYNIFTNNIITGSGTGFGISDQDEASNTTIINNTIKYFNEGIMVGGWGTRSERNIITNNTIIDNTIGMTIVRGDLNEISQNRIDSTLTPQGLAYLIKKGLIKEDSTLPIEEIGFNLEGSYNNLVWENDVYDFNNNYDEGANLYCFNGIANEYYIGEELVFNGTVVNQTLCDQYGVDCASIPACNETLGDGGPFGDGGGLLAGDGWNLFNDPNADQGSAQYSAPNNGDQFSWHVHTLPNTFDVYVWKFEPDYSPFTLASNAKYEIKHSLGTITKTIDWTTPGNEWIYLGRYTFINNPNQGVYLNDNANGYVIADAVRIENIGPPWQNVRRTIEEKIGPHLGPFSL